MVSTSTGLGSLAAALLLVVAVPACSKSGEPAPTAVSPSATESSPPETTSAAGKTQAAPTSAAGGGDTVVFEVTGTGAATTIDLVPAGAEERLYDVPLPWSSTVTIGPDVAQLQVVAVGSGVTNPGCRITLNGAVVAEKPEGGDAQCVFDR